MIHIYGVTKAGKNLRAVMENPKHFCGVFESYSGKQNAVPNSPHSSVFLVIAEGWLAKAYWALLTKKGSVIALLASWSDFSTSACRPWTDLSILKGAQASEEMCKGFRKGIGSHCRQQEKGRLFTFSFNLKQLKDLAPFWIVIRKWNWIFPVLLGCVSFFFFFSWLLLGCAVVFGFCIAFGGSFLLMIGFVEGEIYYLIPNSMSTYF